VSKIIFAVECDYPGSEFSSNRNDKTLGRFDTFEDAVEYLKLCVALRDLYDNQASLWYSITEWQMGGRILNIWDENLNKTKTWVRKD
jgi:hypothetical protein